MPEPAAHPSPARPLWWHALLLLLAGLAAAVLAGGLRGGFFFDDYPSIVSNPSVHVDELSVAALKQSLEGPGAGLFGRPLSVLSFALTHALYGLDPFAFKAVNLAIHLLNAGLVAWLLTLLLHLWQPRASIDAGRYWLILWVVGVWLLHPINVLPVFLSVQRMTLLSALFLLLALVSHLRGLTADARGPGRWAWLAVGWLVFWPLSVLSKETGLLFPLYVAAVHLLLMSGPERRLRNARALGLALGLFGLIAAWLLYRLGTDWILAGYAMRSFTLSERLLTEARVLWFYAAQIVFPVHERFGLFLDGYPLSRGLWNPPTTALALTAWAGVLGSLGVLFKRQPLLAFGVLWFLLGHAMESTILPLEIAHEHRNYLPSLGLLLGVGGAVVSWMGRIKADHPRLIAGLLAVFSLLYATQITWMRAQQLGDPVHGPQLEVLHHPNSPRANQSASLALMNSGRGHPEDPVGSHIIRFHLEKAAAVDPHFKNAHQSLLVWACGTGRSVEPGWVDGLAYRLEHTPFGPQDRDLPANLLQFFMRADDCVPREDVARIMLGGFRNEGLAPPLRAAFAESLADYELLVSLDWRAAMAYLEVALQANPADRRLRTKLAGFQEMAVQERGAKQDHGASTPHAGEGR